MRMMMRAAAILAVAFMVQACGGGGLTIVNAVVAGTHFIVFLWGQAAGGHTDSSDTGTVMMDGSGTATTSTTNNLDGTVTGPSGGPASYQAFSDGSLEITPPGGAVFSGGYDAAANLSVLASVTNGEPPQIVLTARRNGTTLSNASMSGDYFVVIFATDPTGPSHRCETGLATFDGAGNILATVTTNTEGTVVTGGGGAATYSVAADGTMTVTIGADVYSGGLMDPGGVAILGSTSGGSDPAIMILVKKAGAFSAASLMGDYWLATFSSSSGSHSSSVGTANFNGAGSVTASLTDNDEGTVSGGGGTAIYGVLGDGTFVLGAGDTWAGGVLSGGSIFVAATTASGDNPGIMVGIKR